MIIFYFYNKYNKMPNEGSLLQLVSKGAEDIPLTFKPDITLFKNEYKHHTVFSMESIEQLFVDTPKFGSTSKIKIKRDGDLIHKMYLKMDLPYDTDSDAMWTNRIGFRIINKVEFYIGNVLLDRQYGHYMHVWSELTHSFDKKQILDKLVGSKGNDGYSDGLSVNKKHSLNIPLMFFFCNKSEMALPLLAIREKDIYIKVFFEKKVNCIQSGSLPTGDISNVSLWVDYIFLDDYEKKYIVSHELEYLFETTQHYQRNLVSNGEKRINLPFNLSTKELLWTINKLTPDDDKFTDFIDIDSLQIKINETNVFSTKPRKSYYFNKVLPYKFHSGKPDKGINCLPFCMEPEKYTPTGSLYLKNINNFSFNIKSSGQSFINIYSRCYNMLKIKNGYIELVNK